MRRLYPLSFAAAMFGIAVTASAALAQPYPPGPPGPGYNHPPGGWHQWHQGDHYNGPRVVVNNYAYYRLRPPPPGYQWVRNGGQFVMIAIASGIVADIIINSQYQ